MFSQFIKFTLQIIKSHVTYSSILYFEVHLKPSIFVFHDSMPKYLLKYSINIRFMQSNFNEKEMIPLLLFRA